MVARMRCKDSEGREQGQARAWVEAAYPLPPFTHFHRSVMAGPWDQLFIRGCVRRTGGSGLLSGHGGSRGPFGCGAGCHLDWEATACGPQLSVYLIDALA